MGYNWASGRNRITARPPRFPRSPAPRRLPDPAARLAAAALAGAVLLAGLAGPCGAAGLGAFDEAALAAAQARGAVVLVHFTAVNCRVCEGQARELERLLSEPPFDRVVGFQADFDTAAGAVRRFQASSRSTLVLLRGRNELARAAGIDTYDELRAFLRKSFEERKRGRPKRRPSNRVPPRP